MSHSRPINPPGLPAPVGFSHGIHASGAILALAGQIGSDESGRVAAPGDLVAQTERALRNLLLVVAAAGGQPQDVVALTFYVTDVPAYRAARAGLGDVWRRLFGRYYPAIALVGVNALFDEAALVEVAGLAVLGREASETSVKSATASAPRPARATASAASRAPTGRRGPPVPARPGAGSP